MPRAFPSASPRSFVSLVALLVGCALALFATPAHAQPPEPILVAGSPDYGQPAFDRISDVEKLGNSFYFLASNQTSGSGLWASDAANGTRLLTSADTGFSQASGTSTLVLLKNTLLFFAQSEEGLQLWRSDGTSGGTRLIKRFAPSFFLDNGSIFDADDIIVFDGYFYFELANRDDDTISVWRSDGVTVTPTQIVLDENALRCVQIAATGSGWYFFRKQLREPDSSDTYAELWYFDLAKNESRLVRSLEDFDVDYPEIDYTEYKCPFVLGDLVVFFDTRKERTETGDTEYSYVLRALDDSSDSLLELGAFSAVGLAEFIQLAGETLYFSTSDGLWQSDGTPDGTQRLPPFLDGTGTPLVDEWWRVGFGIEFKVLGDQIYLLQQRDEEARLALWRGSRDSTEMELIYEIPFAEVSGGAAFNYLSITQLDAVDDELVFGTYLSVTGLNDSFYLNDNNDLSQVRLWHSDGTSAGTAPLFAPPAPPHMKAPREMITAGQRTYFAFANEETGLELWSFADDDASAGPVADIEPGPSSARPDQLTAVSDSLYFTVNGATTSGLWRTDGTSAGTQRITGQRADGTTLERAIPTLLVPGEETLYFAVLVEKNSDGGDYQRYTELWRVEPSSTTASFVTRVELPDQQDVAIHTAKFLNGRLYFIVYEDSEADFEPVDSLWVSDGTAAGTQKLDDLPLYHASSYSRTDPEPLAQLFAVGDMIYIASSNLWQTDGTVGGATQIASGGLSPVNNYLFYSSDSQIAQREGQILYLADYQFEGGAIRGDWIVTETLLKRVDLSTDGAVSEKSLSLDNVVGALGVIELQATIDGVVYFSAKNQLWRSDGTAAGTELLVNVNTVSRSRGVANFQRVGDTLFFSAQSERQGAQIWQSDGTARGTFSVANLSRQQPFAAVEKLTAADSQLVFVTTNAVGTDEAVWTLDIGGISFADVYPYSVNLPIVQQ